MRKVLFLLAVFSCIAIHSVAQTHVKTKIDSLLSVLKTVKPDTVKVNTLNAIAFEFRSNKPDTAIYFAREAQALAIRLDYKPGICNAYLNIGLGFTNLGNYKEALNNFHDVLILSDQLLTSGKPSGKVKILQQKSKAYNNIGTIYFYQGNYPEALKSYLASLKINEECGYKTGIANNYINIGNINISQWNYPEALKNYSASLKIYEEIGDKRGIAITSGNIGIIYQDEGIYPEALKNFFASLKIWEEIGDKQGIARSYNNIGLVYSYQDNYPEALKNYIASLKIREETGDKKNMAVSYNNIGKLYKIQKKYKEASEYLKKGLSLAKEIGSLQDMKESYDAMSTIDSLQGNFKQSLEYYKMCVITEDSMFNRENTKKMVQTNMQYAFDKRRLADSLNNEKDKLQREVVYKEKLHKKNTQRNIFFFGGIAILLLAGGLWISLRDMRRSKAIIQKEKERSEELLLNILPYEVAEELKQTGHCQAKTFSMVTVMFADFKDFTNVSEKVSAELLVDEINYCFSAFDHIVQNHKVEKIKTVGDAYICVSGLPALNTTHASDMMRAAIEIRNFMLTRKKEKEAREELPFELRIGIHTGPVVAGIVGLKKFQYDIWGDTVNLAARMESNGEAGQVNISGTTYELVKDKFTCTHRGKIETKNKGEIEMYFVKNQN